MNETQLVQALNRTRNLKGLTCAQVAELAGLCRPGVSKALHGRKKPCLASVCKLADALGLRVVLSPKA